MKKILGLFIIIAFTNVSAISQSHDSLLKIYNTQTIYHLGNKYIKGNEKLSFRYLKMEFNSEATKEMYKKSKRRLLISRICNVASLGLVIASATSTNVDGAIKYLIGTSVLGIGGLYFQNQSTRYIEKAIWQRNKEILFNTTQ